MSESLLSVQGLSARYGAIEALRGVSLEVGPGEIVCLIGANGAGKSTLLRAICGQPSFTGQVTSGQVWFAGENVTQSPTRAIIASGLAQVPEGRRIFPRLTVLENLQLGAQLQPPQHFRGDLDKVVALFPRLGERLTQLGGTLSGGEQQMLALGRALMARPKMLLLDEPSLGLAPLVIRQIFDTLAKLNREEGLTIFLVEQNAHLALKLAHRGLVLAGGVVQLQGDSETLRNDPAVQAAYLEGHYEK